MLVSTHFFFFINFKEKRLSLQTKMIGGGPDFSNVWVIDVKYYMDLSDTKCSILHNLFDPANRKV